ncbi:uncharacterized protein M6B38_141385 [Iris pallida]|uniref:Uncharacterized protein n=1 Tax=Iris pallida TaxID=29817 RepID=A0AAX6FBS5_IRIPA|nr:uncharacterized protein M6B38_141385 [Iris pallida]
MKEGGSDGNEGDRWERVSGEGQKKSYRKEAGELMVCERRMSTHRWDLGGRRGCAARRRWLAWFDRPMVLNGSGGTKFGGCEGGWTVRRVGALGGGQGCILFFFYFSRGGDGGAPTILPE